MTLDILHHFLLKHNDHNPFSLTSGKTHSETVRNVCSFFLIQPLTRNLVLVFSLKIQEHGAGYHQISVTVHMLIAPSLHPALSK